MRKIALAIQFFAASAFPQQQPPISERIEVSVVNVDVTVTGADGQPVRGLTQNDFEVFEDGRRQTITNFYAVSNDARATAQTAEQRFRRRVLVLVDVFHTTTRNRAIALASLEKMIDDSFQTGDYDWSFAILGRGVTMVLPLTTDKQQIHSVLQRMVTAGERHVPALAADQPFRNSGGDVIDLAMMFDEQERMLAARFTTEAIVDAVRGFASTTGKKIMLFLTGDLGLNDLDLTSNNFSSNGGDFFQRPLDTDVGRRARAVTDMRAAVTREANASGVNMYIFNVEGLQPMGDLGAAPKPITNTSAAFWLSKDTGGRLVTGNDAAIAVRQFNVASSNYYSLGYRPPHPDGKYHQIEVRLKNVKGARLDYRTGYVRTSGAEELARAMESPIAASMMPNSLPVTLQAETPQPDKRGIAVPIGVRVPFSSLQFLPVEGGFGATVRVFVSVFDEVGKNIYAGSFPLSVKLPAANPQGVMVYKTAVVLRKGQSGRIVAAVRDETTENVGVAEINIPNR